MRHIAGGSFWLGREGDRNGAIGIPTSVSNFAMDSTEVTVEQYRRCVDAGRCVPSDEPVGGGVPDGPVGKLSAACNWGKAGRDRHPINCIDAAQAEAYCAWAGKRLPTETEWEYAAKGPDERAFPWGNEEPASQLCWSGPWNSATGRGESVRVGTCAVAAFRGGDSPFGLSDMAGNVWEWTLSPYCGKDQSPCSADVRVSRGGCYADAVPGDVRTTTRAPTPIGIRDPGVGFRCVRAL